MLGYNQGGERKGRGTTQEPNREAGLILYSTHPIAIQINHAYSIAIQNLLKALAFAT
jgi:hypothetical protein